MKILQINAVYKFGSTGRTVFELHNHFLNHGIDSYVAGPFFEKGNDKIIKIGNRLDWKFHALFSRIFGLQGYYSKGATKRFIKKIKIINPDAIILRNIHANYINLKILFNYLNNQNISTIINLDDCWYFTGKCVHYTLYECCRWKTGCHNCPKLKMDNISWFFDRTRRMWNDKKELYSNNKKLGVIGVSNWIVAEATQSILSKAKSIKCIYNWIDLNAFKPTPSEFRDEYGLVDKFVILCVASSWSEKKGLSSIIDLSNNLDNNQIVVMVGDCKESLPKNIIHIPSTSSVDELAKIYSSADVFLQASREESFGKVAAEALSCGVPLITVDSTANKELVTKKTGILLEDLNLENLKKAILEIQGKGKKFYSDECMRFSREHFDYNKLTSELIDFISDLCNK